MKLGLPRNVSTLHVAVGVSLAVHGVLLGVRFVDPEGYNRMFEDSPLEVVLVNSRSTEAPEKAQAIAQASLAGGGDAATGRATSPLPLSALTEVGDTAETVGGSGAPGWKSTLPQASSYVALPL